MMKYGDIEPRSTDTPNRINTNPRYMGFLDIPYKPSVRRNFDSLKGMTVVPAFRNESSAITLIEIPKVKITTPISLQDPGIMMMSGKNIWINTIMIIDINRYVGGSNLSFFTMCSSGKFS
jgi:hypothetical protein